MKCPAFRPFYPKIPQIGNEIKYCTSSVSWSVKSEKHSKVCAFPYTVISLSMEVKLKIHFGCSKVSSALSSRTETMTKTSFLSN